MKGLKKKGGIAIVALGVVAAGAYAWAHHRAVTEVEAALEAFRNALPEGSTLAYQVPKISLFSRTATVNDIKVSLPEDSTYTAEQLTIQVDGETIQKADITQLRFVDGIQDITAETIHIEDARIPAFGPQGLDWRSGRIAFGEALGMTHVVNWSGTQATQKIGRYTIRGLQDGKLAVLEAADMAVKSEPELSMTTKSMRMEGLHIADLMDVSRSLESRMPEIDFEDETQVLEAMPVLLGLHRELYREVLRGLDVGVVEGMTVDLPDGNSFSVRSFSLAMGDRGADRLPKRLTVTLEDILLPLSDVLPPNVNDLLTKSDVRDLPLSIQATVHVDPEHGTAALDPLSIEVSPVVRVSTGLRVNGAKDVDIARMLESLDDVALVEASLTVTDLGKMKTILGHHAEATGVPTEQVVAEISLMAGMAVAGMFPEQGEAAMTAVRALLTERDSLEIQAKPENPVPVAALLVAPQGLGLSVHSY